MYNHTPSWGSSLFSTKEAVHDYEFLKCKGSSLIILDFSHTLLF